MFTGNFFWPITNIKNMSLTTISLSLISSLVPANCYVLLKLPFKTSATHERRQSGGRALRAVRDHLVTMDVAVEQLWPFRERYRKLSVWKGHWWQSVWCSVIKATLECVCPPTEWFLSLGFSESSLWQQPFFSLIACTNEGVCGFCKQCLSAKEGIVERGGEQ